MRGFICYGRARPQGCRFVGPEGMGGALEDIYDAIIAGQRNGEATMPLEDFEAELRAEGLAE